MSVALPIAALPLVQPNPLADETGPRNISAVRTLRISVTDRCNFRCVYCMPEDKIDWVPHDEVLSHEEIVRIARAAVSLGITSFKITGGEPLVRRDLPHLVASLRALEGVTDLSMTTNGSLLEENAAPLRTAGLDRITVSLDTMDATKFREITRGAELAQVERGIRAAIAAGFGHPKINVVAMRGFNDNELADFATMTLDTDVSVRFIEFMPLGKFALGGEYEDRFISEQEIRRNIEQRVGLLEPASRDSGHGPANVWRIAGARGRIGFISAMSKPFCATCNRLRLTAQGQLRSCLFDGGEVELRPLVRSRSALNKSNRSLRDAFIKCVSFKPEVHSYHGNRQMSQMGG